MSTHNEIALLQTVVAACAIPALMVVGAFVALACEIASAIRAALRKRRAAKAKAKAAGACARVDIDAIRRDLALETFERARRVRARVEGTK